MAYPLVAVYSVPLMPTVANWQQNHEGRCHPSCQVLGIVAMYVDRKL